MKKLIGWLLLGLYLSAGVHSIAPLVGYWVNQELIATELCVNKARPELGCNGQCHLKAAQADQQSDTQQQAPVEVTQVNLSPHLHVATVAVPLAPVAESRYPHYPHHGYVSPVLGQPSPPPKV